MVEIYIPQGRPGSNAPPINPNFQQVTSINDIGMQVQQPILPDKKDQPINVEEEIKGEGTDMEVPLPQTCDIKEALINKLVELDTKIYMLIKSNKAITEEMADDPDIESYLEENNSIIVRTKDEILKILNAFLQAGIDIDQQHVLDKMTHRLLYMPDDIDRPQQP